MIFHSQLPTLVPISQQENLDATIPRVCSRLHSSLWQNRRDWRGATCEHLLQAFLLLCDGIWLAARQRDGAAHRTRQADLQRLKHVTIDSQRNSNSPETRCLKLLIFFSYFPSNPTFRLSEYLRLNFYLTRRWTGIDFYKNKNSTPKILFLTFTLLETCSIKTIGIIMICHFYNFGWFHSNMSTLEPVFHASTRNVYKIV